MTYRGLVKNGRIELADGVTLPEGTRVTVLVEIAVDEWLAESEKLAQKVSEASPGRSVVEELFRCREERQRSVEGTDRRGQA